MQNVTSYQDYGSTTIHWWNLSFTYGSRDSL